MANFFSLKLQQVQALKCTNSDKLTFIAKYDRKMSLLIDKHVRYFQMCLNSLPQKAQCEDSNKLALVYFCLHGLALMGKLDVSEHRVYVDHIYEHLILLQDDSIQAFRSSQTFALDPSHNDYDLPNLASTFFALAILLILKEDFSKKIDRHKLMRFVARCQIQSGPDRGSFRPVLDNIGEPFGESDLRLCYIAVSIRTILGYDKLDQKQREADIHVPDLQAFILDKVSITGGLASSAYSEPHSGLTFCGIAALSLIDPDFRKSDDFWIVNTINWLAHRQVDYPTILYDMDYEYQQLEDIGGFNGRPNKFSDTCYSWWVTALMKILRGPELLLFDNTRAVEYLLSTTQHKLMGGFGKDPQAFPDPFHSFLGLASLALIAQCKKSICFDGVEVLTPIDEQLVITKELRSFAESLW